MIIFVEGCDGSGKSTLIKQLSERYPVMRIPRAAEIASLWSDVLRLGRNNTILMDRSPLTELVYRSWENAKSKFGYVNVLTWIRRGKLIYCKTNTSFEDAQKRGEDFVTEAKDAEKLQNLYDTMITAMRTDDVRILDYNWRTDSLDKVIDFIEGGNNNESDAT